MGKETGGEGFYQRERISLSIRQTREDPWEEFARESTIGVVVLSKRQTV